MLIPPKNKISYRVQFKKSHSKFDTTRERTQLELGSEQSFINKNKNQRKYLDANLESINQKEANEIKKDQK